MRTTVGSSPRYSPKPAHTPPIMRPSRGRVSRLIIFVAIYTGDRLSRACKPDSASAVPKLHLPPQFIAKIEQSKGKNKIAPPSFYKKRGSLLLPANREVLPVSAGEGSASGAVGSMLVDTNRAIADKSSLFVSVTVKILLFLFHIRPKSLTLQPDKETNNAKTDLFYRLCLAPCLVR